MLRWNINSPKEKIALEWARHTRCRRDRAVEIEQIRKSVETKSANSARTPPLPVSPSLWNSLARPMPLFCYCNPAASLLADAVVAPEVG